MRQVDEIVVESDEPVKVMTTLGYDNGSLEPGWTAGKESSYRSASEDARASDEYINVYSRHQVPRDFDLSAWVPYVDDFAVVDIGTAGAYWNFDLYCERYLPIEEESNATEVEYLEPFALIAKPDRLRDLATQLSEDGNAPYDLEGAQDATNPQMSESEFNDISTDDDSITASDIAAYLANATTTYIHLDRAQQFEYPACTFRLADSGLGFFVGSTAPHIFGANKFTGSSDIDALFDYRTILATVFFRTDEMLRVRLPVWGGSYVGQNGQNYIETNPQGQQIHIVVPGQECWVAAPQTVTSVDNGVLQYYNGGFSGVLRDDSERIWWTALVAYVWYGQQRASAEFTIENNLPWFRIGDLVKATLSGYWWERIGTVVTSITHDSESGSQVVRTAYGEMAPAVATDSEVVGQ
jgi:hypothetical protein